jgi:flagellar motor switch protein FliG
MFTFEDLAKLDGQSVQKVLRQADKAKVPLGLKGASETLRDLFFSNMSERASKLLKEEMQQMGPVRLRDVEEAQSHLVSIAKDLAASGEIVIADSKGDDELVY